MTIEWVDGTVKVILEAGDFNLAFAALNRETWVDNNERIEIFRLHAEFCKTLSDANRLLIIAELSRGEISVNDIGA